MKDWLARNEVSLVAAAPVAFPVLAGVCGLDRLAGPWLLPAALLAGMGLWSWSVRRHVLAARKAAVSPGGH